MGDVARLSGALLPTDPTVALEAATKQYVDSRVIAPGAIGSFLTDFRTTSVTVANTTLTTVLAATVVSGAKYLLDGYVLYNGPTAGKIRFSFPALGTDSWWSLFGVANTVTTRIGDIDVEASGVGGVRSVGTDGSNGTSFFGSSAMLRGLVVASGTSLLLQMSQTVATAPGAVVRPGSWMRLMRVA